MQTATIRYFSAWAPAKLPIWGHIAQMRNSVRRAPRTRPFPKKGHRGAYKSLPVGPMQANTAAVALAGPSSDRWIDMFPRATLFGAVSAVIHYNFLSSLSRTLAVLFSRIPGIHVLSYMGDFGALVPIKMRGQALRTCRRFCTLLGVKRNPEETFDAETLTFLGLRAAFPNPENDVRLRAVLSPEKPRFGRIGLWPSWDFA